MADDKKVIVKKAEPFNEDRQRRMYGGFNFGAAFFGWLAAIGIGVLLTALLSGIGSAIALTASNVAGTVTDNAPTIGIVGAILLLLDLAIAYYAGGYVAGRMSRFDGGRQGLGVWIISIVVALLLGGAGAAFGAKYNLLQQVNLPHIPIKEGNYTTAGIITAVATIVITLLSAIGGGKAGEYYHRKVNRAGLTEE